MITEISQLEENGIYSYADYLTWKIKERLELIKGKIMKMSPAPNTNHQRVSLKLANILSAQFEEHPCELFVAPFDVRLLGKRKIDSDNDVYTVVQPDLCVVCDAGKIDARGCVGAPDLIIEILSPGNTDREMGIKFELYQEAGVKEYWMVSLQDRNLLRYTLVDGRYIGLPPLIEANKIESPLFPDLDFELVDIFPKEQQEPL